MSKKSPRKQTALINAVVRAAAKKKCGGKDASLARFIRLYYGDVLLADMAACSTGALACAALSVWSLGQLRASGKIGIRIFNPSVKQDGWESSHTVIEIINNDMPFLVDSVTAELNRNGLTVHHIVHPVFDVLRTPGGKLSRIDGLKDGGDKACRESFMHIEVDQQMNPDFISTLQAGLESVLEDVRLAVQDWAPLRSQMHAIISETDKTPPPLPMEAVAEDVAFFRWLLDDHFTFLGYREYHLEKKGNKAYLKPVAKSGLGILRKPSPKFIAGSKSPAPLKTASVDRKDSLLIVTKTTALSTVHRLAHMEYIGIRIFDANGNVTGERRFLGLYTSTAYSRSPREIPILRHKVAATLARAGFLPASHSGKALLHILENFPRDELFQISEADLSRISMGILALQERKHVALFCRHDPFQRFVSCLVYLPRDIYNTELRERIEKVLEESYGGETTDYYTKVGDSVLARLRFLIRITPGKALKLSDAAIEKQLIVIARSWEEDLRDALIEVEGESQGLSLLRKYGKGFPPSYREHFDACAAIDDIEKISDVLENKEIALSLYRKEGSASNALRFKIYNYGKPVPLSDALPMLENMGLRVIGEVPFEISPKGGAPVFIHDFHMVTEGGIDIPLDDIKENFEEAFLDVWKGRVEDDVFNRLVLIAGLTSREVVVLRAFRKFLRQIGVPFSLAYMGETLAGNASIARLIMDLFAARFDPRNRHRAEVRVVKLRNAIEAALEKVPNLDQDRILRRFYNLVESTLRTNYFQQDGEGQPKPYLSFKFASRLIKRLPLPRPMFEIFVYSPRMEGVHLRGGRIARGGIRWSDRREDFRTEILGLMKAQMVKNAVIVPVGAKGGFVVKRPPAEGGREALMAEVIACYQMLIRGMLDLTDNLDGNQAVQPLDTICKDEADPYLVVAADKGTATFSDIANAISKDYGFWLGDAFASGGSQGYDHKKMGITARGAWESVKRHFRELGVDIQKTDFTVLGVGDMSGDVFGNGMLLSRHICLLAAFNHQHIFIDPDPDPATSFLERKRLFKMPRSSWTDYNAKLISKGGGIFDRAAKSVKLSPEIQKRFAIPSVRITPNDLMRYLLRAEADLLWLGGIGTYVKASSESSLDAGDRANDAIRVDATELRCKVIGEGANLGITQFGRVEYALEGGHLNADSVDNSAGVNCSDHEVNIKILLNEVVASGKLTEQKRNALLVRMTKDVSNLVLRDNYLHTQAITYVASRASDFLDGQAALIRTLEDKGLLDREIEFLPSDAVIEERLMARQGLTRPEISVLISYVKNWLYSALLESDIPDDPFLAADFTRYFPAPLCAGFARQIANHRLRREIIATQVANGLISRMGGAMVAQLAENTGMPLENIAYAYLVVREAFGLSDLWEGVETLDNKVAVCTQTEMFGDIGRLVEQATFWFLRNGDRSLAIAAHLKKFSAGVSEFTTSLGKILPEAQRNEVKKREARYVSAGVPRKLAAAVASMDYLAPAFDVVVEAQSSSHSVEEIGTLYFKVGVVFGLDWLRVEGRQILPESHWQKTAIEAILDDLSGQQAALTCRIVRAAKGAARLDGILDSWILANKIAVERTRQMLNEIHSASALHSFDLAMLTVANRQMRSLIQA
ncbi:MAG: NAD-glutamate dehydrogenase [Rhodospirillaceae bacterium]|nr:MAG: NAD-glutamate dehydrogenase [Rhodospirillaceae bacterium]